jgi:DNA-binding Lrp family transcriptional regulator
LQRKLKNSFVAPELDRVDRRLLRLLQSNERLTNAELAKKVSVSPATCHRRTRRLFDEGYVRVVRAMVVPERVERGKSGNTLRKRAPRNAHDHPGLVCCVERVVQTSRRMRA